MELVFAKRTGAPGAPAYSSAARICGVGLFGVGWHIQTPGATLPRQNRTAPRLSSTAKTALTYSAVILHPRSGRTGPGPLLEFALTKRRSALGAPELPSAARKFGVGCWGGRSRAQPRSRFRHRGPAGPRNPRRGGSADGSFQRSVEARSGPPHNRVKRDYVG